MLDQSEWDAMLSSFKTLLGDERNLKIWSWVAPTFPADFVKLVQNEIGETPTEAPPSDEVAIDKEEIPEEDPEEETTKN
jgi:hypothetical protein